MESTTDLTQWLPEDVFVAVLRRLAPHGLAAARCVGKAWRTVIDARRLLDLFPPSLAGIFINFFDLEISEFFFWPPRDTDTAVSGRLDYVAPTENDDTCIMDHCNGLLLFCTYVANPATRRWAPLPPPPPGFGHDHIVFDPAISPHYEVLDILALPCCTTGVELHHEWPPSPFIMHVFFSTTGNWEERPFARQGDAIGTVAHLKQRVNWCTTQKHPAYWRGQLYVLNQFVMRLSPMHGATTPLSKLHGLAIELRNAFTTSVEASLLSKHMAYSMTVASQGSMMRPSSPPPNPNSS
ncbi:hypothetical protein ACQ4PT_052314 [Festuca glaucescens]